MKKIKFLFVLLLMITTCFTLTSCKYDRYIDDAIINDDFDYVKEYFTKYPKSIDEPMSSVFLSEFGYAYETPLIYGCLNFASIDMVKLLVEEFNADVNICLEGGWTPLLCACLTSNDEIQKYLLDKGADLEVIEKFNEITYEKEYQVIVIYSTLLDCKRAYRFNIDVLKYILDNDILINESRFASIAFEEIMKDAIEELDPENSPVDLDKLENHLPVLKILIECDINPEYFMDEEFKNEYESALEIVELLKQLENK